MKAKRVLEMLEVHERIDSREVQIMFDQGWGEVLKVAAEIASTRSGDSDDPETKKNWAENAKILNDAASKLPVVHW
jgi:hypothetical protein